MKKVLFTFPKCNIGGAEKAMFNMMNDFHDKGYDVHVFFMFRGGEGEDLLPEYVKVVVPFTMSQESVEKDIIKTQKAYSVRTHLRKCNIIKAIKNYSERKQDPINLYQSLQNIDCDINYDIAICMYLYNAYILRLVSLINADRKYVMVHNPFSTSELNRKKYPNLDVYIPSQNKPALRAYDKIISVSNGIKMIVDSACPEFTTKSIVIYNQMPVEAILNKARVVCELPKTGIDEIKLVSVGRLSHQKGFDMAIKAASILKGRGVKFHWFIVGDGEERYKLEKLISRYRVNDVFTLLGVRINPYPIINACDIYCQPSRSEAYCSTVNEARILKKPIVATDFIGIREQIENDISGLITKFNAKKFASAIIKMCEKDFRIKISENVSYPNEWEANSRTILESIIE